MNWFIIALIAHFLFAVVFIIDKFILTKTPLNPVSYAFYSGFFQILVLLLIPFGFYLIPTDQILISFLGGALFVFATLCLYRAFRLSEVSKITPIVGGAIPVFIFILTYLFLGERLLLQEIAAFLFLVAGGVIILWPKKEKKIADLPEVFWLRGLLITLLSAFLFACSFAITKYIFNLGSFVNGLIWLRLGSVLAALIILIWPGNYQKIFDSSRALKAKAVGVFAFNKIISASSSFLLNYAIFLGSVTLVNALQGAQYIFLLIIALVLSVKFPHILREQISRGIITQKLIGILLIAAGLNILG